MGISPQLRWAVERALERAKKQTQIHRDDAEETGVTLQLVAWTDECESLEEVVDLLKGME